MAKPLHDRVTREPPVFGSLPFCEQFTLWTARFWMEAERSPACLHPLLRQSFSQFGARDAYSELNLLPSIVTADSPRPFAVNSGDCPALGADVLLFLGLVASTQHRPEHVAHAMLYRTLPARPAPRGVPVGACYATDKASRPDPCPPTRMPRDMPVVLPSPLYRKCVSPPGNTRSTNGARNRLSATARFPSAPTGAAGGSKTAAAVRMPSNAVISP